MTETIIVAQILVILGEKVTKIGTLTANAIQMLSAAMVRLTWQILKNVFVIQKIFAALEINSLTIKTAFVIAKFNAVLLNYNFKN